MSHALQSLSRRTSLPQCQHVQHDLQQIRHATLIRRPKRPYTFTQLVTLTDGSTYLHRTTSPLPVYRSTKDARNSPMWNPSSQKLLNIEEDEAGKLRSFRAKFGRGWDAEAAEYNEDAQQGEKSGTANEGEDSLLDLISGYGKEPPKKKEAKAKTSAGTKDAQGKGEKK